ncbi:hypothetical protein AAFF_G00033440 [Aldrovandia affinis]|uniref:Immunoglobulin-like and fibronectin type III domain-containing protein 1 n=1 Tax=Aldrovandia affinis TaxID=143900 RepID=A0AAD7S3L5_9TELE|nr:hypothetical protein AAFF_G00033440 [Aldrovandia affinis]
MITQFVEELPEGMTTPDFTRKPIALTIQEDQADTYKCFASNEFGRAMVTCVLNVIEVGFKKRKEFQQTAKKAEAKPLLKRRRADKKDYERIMHEYGVTDFRWMLKKLDEMRKVREEEQAQVIKNLSNLKHVEVKGDGTASFELDMDLIDPSHRIFIYKDGAMIPYSKELDMEMKHILKHIGRKYIFTIKDLLPDDGGFYQVDVEDVNIFSTDLKIHMVDFVVKIQEVKAMEREDALFECVLSKPFSKIMWMGKNSPLEQGEKYDITVSEDKLIHRLVVKDCQQLDKGIYAAVAGIKSCSAWLVVEADNDPNLRGKKKERKTTRAGGAGANLEKIAQEQQAKLQKEKEEKPKEEKKDTGGTGSQQVNSGDGGTGDVGTGTESSLHFTRGLSDVTAVRGQPAELACTLSSEKFDGVWSKDGEKLSSSDTLVISKDGANHKLAIQSCKDSDAGQYQFEAAGCKTKASLSVGEGSLHFTRGLSDVTAVRGEPAELGCTLSSDKFDGIWSKDGEKLSSSDTLVISKDGANHKLAIQSCKDSDAGQYQFEAEGCKTKASLSLGDGSLHFTRGLSDVTAVWGEPAELACTLSSEKCDGVWSKDGEKLSSSDTLVISKDGANHKLAIQSCKDSDAGQYQFEAEGCKTKASLSVRDSLHFTRGLSDVTAIRGRPAVLGCTLSSEKCDGVWSKDGEKLSSSGTLVISKDGANHKLAIQRCKESDAGQYQFEAEGCKTKASLTVEVLHFTRGLSDVTTVRGQPAELACTLSSDKCDDVWSKDGEKLSSSDTLVISKNGANHKLAIQSCKDSDAGQYQFEAEGCNTKASLSVGEPPMFDLDDLQKFSKPVIVRVGQNAAFKLAFGSQDQFEVKWFKGGEELMDGGSVKMVKERTHSRLLLRECLRTDAGEVKIQLKNDYGSVEATTKLIVLDKPGPPQGPVEVVSTSSTLLEIKWGPPKDDGGSPVTNYTLERQQIGDSTWKKLGKIPADPIIYRDRNVSHGKRYSYLVCAMNAEGVSDPLETEYIMAGILVFPGAPEPPKVVSAFKNCINLSWTAPADTRGTTIIGYMLEKRKKDTTQWIALNPVNEPIEDEKYAVRDVIEGAEYQFRVSAINVSGAGDPSGPSELVCAKNPDMKPRFKDPEDFVVVRAGNSVRVNVNYEASPLPEISWLKDGDPVAPWINIINTEGTSQLVIPSSRRSDSGLFTIIATNSVGQARFDIEVRVTDEPKPPGPIELEQNVHGKVIVSWAPSPDAEEDDRLYYVVAERDSITRMWKIVADHLLTTRYTAINIRSGREYHFRVFAKNDMGLSEPSESPTWGSNSLKVTPAMSSSTAVSFERPPSVLVPLKVHTHPNGYQCYMTCAVSGCPRPHVTWYLNNTSLASNKNYYMTNAYGVCSIYILRVSPEDNGEYKVVAVNCFGKAECTTKLTIKD